MASPKSTSDFASRVLDVMERVEYRRIVTAEDMEDVSQLRIKAYKKAKMCVPPPGQLFVDDSDFDPQAFVYGIYCEERLISTIRIHHVTPAHRVSPSRHLFPETVDTLLDSGLSLIDPVRHASDPEVFDDLPALPYLTLRIATMACEYFGADRCLSLVPPRHYPFYKRVFRSMEAAPPIINTPGYDIDLGLLVAHVSTELPKVYERYPFFRSQPFERRMMFAPQEELGTMPLTVIPTARYLQAAS